MSAADLMSRIDGARSGHQRAKDLFADAKAKNEPQQASSSTEEQGGISASDIGHTALDLAGFIPVVGTAADLVNAGWYAAEGDYKNAALSAAAAIPGAGDAAAAAKLGVKAVDAAQAVKRGAEAYETAEGIATGAEYASQGNYSNAAISMGAAACGGLGNRGGSDKFNIFDDGTNKTKIDNLTPLHGSASSGQRPQLERLSDEELLESINNPRNNDPIRIKEDGTVMDGNGRFYELRKRAADPNSSISADIEVPFERYKSDNSMFPDLN